MEVYFCGHKKRSVLTTERLKLRPLAPSDAVFILALVNTEGWLKNIGDRNVHSLADAEIYTDNLLNSSTLTYWVVSLKEKNVSIGVVTIIKKDYLDHPDIGFAFLPAYYKNGYAFEAARAVLDQAELPLVAVSIPDNMASINLLLKLGFVFKESIKPNNEPLNLYIFNGTV